MPQDISRLSGSAAKLLLAYLTTHSREDINALVDRSGISTFKTWRKAEQELTEGGYFIESEDKTRYVKLDVAGVKEIVLPK